MATVEAAAYYVVAEALTNVGKYAHASGATVAITRSNGCATVTVCDDGIGGADPAHGSGLHGLAARVESLNGRLAVDSHIGVEPHEVGAAAEARLFLSFGCRWRSSLLGNNRDGQQQRERSDRAE